MTLLRGSLTENCIYAEPPVASAKPFSNPVKPYSKRKVCVDGKVMITATSARHIPTTGRVQPSKQRLDLKTVRDLGRLDSPSRYGRNFLMLQFKVAVAF